MTETELIAALRLEWKAAFETAQTSHDVEVFKKIDTDLTAKTAALLAPLVTRAEELEGKVKRFMESRGLPQGQGVAVAKTFGNAFTDSDAYKNAIGKAFGRHDRISTIVTQRIATERKVITEAGSGIVLPPLRVGVFQAVPDTPLKIRDLFRVIPISGTNAIEYLEETWTFNADYQLLEGDKKAESTVAYVPKTAMVRTIAHFVKISRQMWDDVPYVQSTIDDRLIYGLLKKEDVELLNGSGAAGHLLGVMEVAETMTVPPLGTPVIDSILNGIGQVGANGYMASNIVMHPTMWAKLQLTKTAAGVYLLGGPPASLAGLTLWGLPVTLTPVIAATDILVGQFPATAAIFDREAATVDVAFENEDDFIKNLVCIRAEERLAFAVFSPKAYVVVPPAAIA